MQPACLVCKAVPRLVQPHALAACPGYLRPAPSLPAACPAPPQKLAESDDDAHARSAWADPKSLKQAFNGLGGIKVPR
jgi:hypothetical protein